MDFDLYHKGNSKVCWDANYALSKLHTASFQMLRCVHFQILLIEMNEKIFLQNFGL